MSVPQSLQYTGHLLRRAQQRHTALWNQEVSTSVSSVQFAALAVLEERPGISQAELGTALDLDRSTIADLVVRMLRRNLISREQSTGDRRRNVLAITEAGRAELAILKPGVARVEHELVGAMSPSDRDALWGLLATVLVDADGGLVRPSEPRSP